MRATDRDKIITLLELFSNAEVIEAPGSFRANGRRFSTNENGEIIKIAYTDKKGIKCTATDEGKQS